MNVNSMVQLHVHFTRHVYAPYLVILQDNIFTEVTASKKYKFKTKPSVWNKLVEMDAFSAG